MLRISAFEPPRHFRDSMVRGAFARFDHDHHFTPDGAGTLMRDVFDFAAPFGPLGWVAEQLFLTRYMRAFLVRRNEVVKAIAESADWAQFVVPSL